MVLKKTLNKCILNVWTKKHADKKIISSLSVLHVMHVLDRAHYQQKTTALTLPLSPDVH